MLNLPSKLAAASIILLLSGGLVYSQSEIVIEMDEIIVEAEVVEEIPVQQPGAVTVFDRDDIVASGARTVIDVVERAPGVVVSRQGGILEPQTVSIRGSESEHVLVLVDGETADSLWTGGADLGSIPLSNIERIEVIRGASAAAYGEGAVSGVINIITADSRKEQLSASVEYGFASFNTHQLHAEINGPLGTDSGFTGCIAAGALYTGGAYDYGAAGESLERTNNDGWALNGSADAGWTHEQDLITAGVSASFYASEKGAPGLMEFLTPEARTKNIRGSAGADLEFNTEKAGSYNIDGGFSYLYSSYLNPDKEIDDSNDNKSISLSAGWNNFFGIGAVFIDTALNSGYTYNTLYSTALTDSTGSAVDGTAKQHSIFLRSTAEIIIGKFDLSPAAGLDWVLNDYSAAETSDDLAFSWSAAAGWSPLRTDYEEGPLYLELNCGTAYRNPSFQDLFWPAGALASGNPDLRPERSFSFDGGASYSTAAKPVSGRFELTGFFNRTEDLIQWLPSAGGIWRPINIGFVHSLGAEISAALGIANPDGRLRADISGVYNYLQTTDADPDSVNYGKQLAYRPLHSGSLAVLLKLQDLLTLEVAGEYLGYRYTNNADTKYLDNVYLLSAALNFYITPGLSLSAAVDNLLNREYIDRLGYPVPGIEWSLKGRLTI